MIIYYTDKYNGRVEESSKLLKKSIDKYILLTGWQSGGATLNILKTEKGKPYIEKFDSFSVSHSNNVWVVAFDKDECGIDIQFTKNANYISIAKKIFSNTDYESLLSSLDIKKDFFRIWTRREAFIKALGLSVMDTNIPPVRDDEISFNAKKYRMFDIDCEKFLTDLDHSKENLCVSICARNSIEELQFIEL